jgi:hypothetical protein
MGHTHFLFKKKNLKLHVHVIIKTLVDIKIVI